ncbi:MAG: Sec-independent protein translocase protein TatB [Arenicellales bacterium]|nr:Sec-independent protein translocase protein TatB [Arenicellales bacterium]
MFDIGFWELSLIAVIGLLILGPERLPRVARTAGLWVGKLKKMVADVKSNIDEELRMEELNALKQTGEKLKSDLESTQQGLREAGNTFQSSVEDVSNAAESIAKDSDVDIVSAINESAPKIDEELVGVGSTAKPTKNKTEKKAKKKNVKKKAATNGKKVAKKKTAAKKSVARGETTKKKKKTKEVAPELGGKKYKAQVQATSSHSSDLPNQDAPDHNV